MRLKKFKEFIFFYFHYETSNRHFLQKFSSDLKETKYKKIEYQIISLDADENNIYCLTNISNNKIMIFDHDFVNTKNIGQSESPQEPFYLTNDVKRIAYRKGFFFVYIRTNLI